MPQSLYDALDGSSINSLLLLKYILLLDFSLYFLEDINEVNTIASIKPGFTACQQLVPAACHFHHIWEGQNLKHTDSVKKWLQIFFLDNKVTLLSSWLPIHWFLPLLFFLMKYCSVPDLVQTGIKLILGNVSILHKNYFFICISFRKVSFLSIHSLACSPINKGEKSILKPC